MNMTLCKFEIFLYRHSQTGPWDALQNVEKNINGTKIKTFSDFSSSALLSSELHTTIL